MPYSVHGSLAQTRQGQILITDVQGPWNAELIELYQQKCRPHVEALSAQGPWAAIIHMHKEASCPQDAIAGIKQGVIEQAKNRKRVCTAYVIADDVVGYHIMDRVWRGIYKDIIPFEIFERREDAIAWTAQILEQAVV